MKTIIVAIEGVEKIVDNLALLPPVIRTDDFNIIIHNSPLIEQADGVTKNFDILIDCIHGDPSSSRSKEAELLLGSSYITSIRRSKTEQAIILENINQKLNLGFYIPKCYQNLYRTGGKVISRYGAEFDDKVILKPENGAKGEGQAIVPAYALASLFQYDIDKTAKYLKEKYPEIVLSHYNEDREEAFFPTGDLILAQEYLSDIVSEYRVLISDQDMYIYKRKILNKEYRQANITTNTVVDNQRKLTKVFHNGEYFISSNNGSDDIDLSLITLTNIFTMARELDLKLGSMDIFVTESGNVGFFEYCNQFAFWRIHPKIARDIHVNYIKSIVKNWIK